MTADVVWRPLAADWYCRYLAVILFSVSGLTYASDVQSTGAFVTIVTIVD